MCPPPTPHNKLLLHQEAGPAPVTFLTRGHIEFLAMIELVCPGEVYLSGLMQLSMGRGHENNCINNSIFHVLISVQSTVRACLT